MQRNGFYVTILSQKILELNMLPTNKNIRPYKKPSIIDWQGIIDLTKEESAPFKATVDKFIQGNCQSQDLDLKKIGASDYSLYSLRINDADRILYTVFIHQHQPYIVLLEVVYNHDYQKSKFMSPGFLDKFMAQRQLYLTQIIQAQNTSEANEEEKINKIDLSDEYRFVNKQAQEWVVLSNEQQHILNTYQQKNNIMLVSGGPGSGKSIAALSLLMDELQVDHGTKGDALVYLTQSPLLAETMQGLWDQQRSDLKSEDLRTNPFAKKVYFLTYPEFVKQLILESPESMTLLNKEYYQAWFESYSQSLVIKSSDLMKELVKEYKKQLSSIIYKEFRILSGYLTDEGTLDGTRKSFFTKENQRKWVEGAFLAYQKGLKDSQQLDLVFSQIYGKKVRGYVVVDEAQDFSGAQLCSIYRAVEDNRLSFFYDFHQALSDDLSQTKFLMDLGSQYGALVQPILLSGSFRLPSKLVNLANDLLRMGRKLIGGVTDRNDLLQLEQTIEQEEYHQHNPEEFLEWIENAEEIKNNPELITKICDSVDVAIITLEEHKKEAIDLFKSQSIFTVEEIKGLEFAHIIVYRLFDSVEAGQANNHLKTINLNKEPQFFPKAGKENYQFNHLAHLWFTAMTRPKQRLSLIQKAHHHNELILSLIENHFQKTFTINAENLNKSTQEEWVHQAQEALKNANHDYARWICETKLGQSLEAFERRESAPQTQLQQLPLETIVTPPPTCSLVNPEATKLVSLRQNILSLLNNNKIKEVVNLVVKVSNRAKTFVSLCADPDFFQQLVNNYWFIKLLCNHDKDSMPLLNDLLSDHESLKLFLSICVKEQSTQKDLEQFTDRLLGEPTFISALLKRNPRSHLSCCHRLHHIYTKLEEIYPKDPSEEKISSDTDPDNFIEINASLLAKAEFFIQCLILKSQEKIIAHDEYINTLLVLPSQNPPLLLDILKNKELWGSVFLMRLLMNQQAMAKLGTHKEFATVLSKKINGYPGLYYLFTDTSGAGHKVFYQLCKIATFTDSLIKSNNFAKDLFSINEYNYSAFYWLFFFKGGKESFDYLSQQPSFQKYLLEHTDLFLSSLFALSPHNQLSALYWLSFFSKNKQLLSFLFETQQTESKSLVLAKERFQQKFFNHPNLIPALISLRADSSDYVGTSCLHYFFAYPSNEAIAKALSLHVIPALTKSSMFLETLLCCRPDIGSITEKGISLFFELLRTQAGADFLYNLLADEGFLHELARHRHFIKVLLTPASESHPHCPNRCGLHLLLATEEGRNVFSRLWMDADFTQQLKESPQLKQALTTLVAPEKSMVVITRKAAFNPKDSIKQGYCYEYEVPDVSFRHKTINWVIRDFDNRLKQQRLTINVSLSTLDKFQEKFAQNKEQFIKESKACFVSVQTILSRYFPEIAQELLSTTQEEESITKKNIVSL